jgi:hypothetical protein
VAVASAKPIGRVDSLARAGLRLRALLVSSLVTAAGLTTALLALFGGQPADLVVSALVGTALFGAAAYLRGTAELVPRGSVQEAPGDVEVATPQVTLLASMWLAAAFALCVPAAWLMDRWGVSAVACLGTPLGTALASLIALIRIRRWERANGREVLYDPEAEDVRPYAGSPL